MATAVSLFSGCGGSDAGLISAGHNIVFANDVLPYAKAFYGANHAETDYHLGDVSDIKSFPAADILVGCYPCQGFSQAGVRDPTRKINFLYRQFDRALRQIRPKAFIVENVSGMVRNDNLHLYGNQVVRFRSAGYRVSASLLDARDYGVAQERRRLFFVGIRSDFGLKYEFPTPTHHDHCKSVSHHYKTLRDVIGDLPPWPEGEFDTQPFHWYYLSRDRRRGWDEQSRTIVATSRHAPLHPNSPKLRRLGPDCWRFEAEGPARRISYREAARIQGFSGDLVFPEAPSIRSKYRVIGNAVPPPVFEAVARAIPAIW